jgi:hypothetical protein
MNDIFYTPSAAARRLTELGKPRSEAWIRLATTTGRLPCIISSTGRRLLRETDLQEFAKSGTKGEEKPRPAA